MAKDILLYGYIYSYSAEYFHLQINEATKEEPEGDLILRVNTQGGSPDFMQSICAKVQSMQEQFTVIGESQMHSSGFFLMCYIPKDKVSCLDVTKGVLHRASYDPWLEKQESFKGSVYEDVLKRVNKDLEAALRARVDVEALEALPQMKDNNLTVKDIFKLDAYHEIVLGASDMKKIGLVGSITKITPKKLAEVEAIAAKFNECRSVSDYKIAASVPPQKDVEPSNNDIMDLAELKTKYPAIYAQAKAEGHAEGVTEGRAAEKDRVEAIMVFAEIDPEICKAAIESGKPLTQKQINELQLKSFSATTLKALNKDSADDVTTDPPEGDGKTPTAKQKEIAQFSAELDKRLGLKKKPAAA